MDAFPISGWLILILPPILFIGSVVIWYIRELKMEKLENELFTKQKQKQKQNRNEEV